MSGSVLKKITIAFRKEAKVWCSSVEVVDPSVKGGMELEVESALFVFVDGVVAFCPHMMNHGLDEEQKPCHPASRAFSLEVAMGVVIILLMFEPGLEP